MDAFEKMTYDRLVEKTQEAFLLAVELYNRPTIKYHVEGCAISFATRGSSCLRRI